MRESRFHCMRLANQWTRNLFGQGQVPPSTGHDSMHVCERSGSLRRLIPVHPKGPASRSNQQRTYVSARICTRMWKVLTQRGGGFHRPYSTLVGASGADGRRWAQARCGGNDPVCEGSTRAAEQRDSACRGCGHAGMNCIS